MAPAELENHLAWRFRHAAHAAAQQLRQLVLRHRLAQWLPAPAAGGTEHA
jgi:hypothetical protein